MKILKTSNYSQFGFTQSNRPLDTENPKFKKLTASLKRHGWLHSFPLTCYRDGSRYIIVDGQNRYTAAKSLGIPVLYVVLDSAIGRQIDIPALNDTQRAWSIQDHVQTNAASGNPDFHYLVKFAERTHLPLVRAAALLIANQPDSGNVNNSLRDGSFKVRDAAFAERVVAILEAVSGFAEFARTTPFVAAISRCVSTPEFDSERFIQKARLWPGKLVKRSTWKEYLEVIESVYNMKVREPVALGILVEKTMRERSAV